MAEELIFLGGFALLVLFWGSRKIPTIPEVAKILGNAKKEFDRASKEFAGPYASQQVTGDDLLTEKAEKIGLSTEGKTREQIAQEIVCKAKSSTTGIS